MKHATIKTRGKIIGWILGGVVIAAIMAFLFGWIVMLLWNFIMPDIFALPEISYWQGWALVLMAHILFKSHPHKNHHDHSADFKNHWKEKFHSKFKQEKINPSEDVS